MSRRARTRRDKRTHWKDQDNNNQAAYGRFSFGSEFDYCCGCEGQDSINSRTVAAWP